MECDPDSVAAKTKDTFKRLAHLTIICAPIVLMAGCTSMPSVQPDPTPKQTEMIPIISEPPGAVVKTSTGDHCTTPCELEIGRDEKISLSFQKEGFRTKHIKVRPVPEQYSFRAMITYTSIGALTGTAFASMADALINVSAAVFVTAFTLRDPDEFEYETDKSLITKGGLAGALVGFGIGYGVHMLVQEKRLSVREQVLVRLRPISN